VGDLRGINSYPERVIRLQLVAADRGGRIVRLLLLLPGGLPELFFLELSFSKLSLCSTIAASRNYM
jgi:hypothetical protein